MPRTLMVAVADMLRLHCKKVNGFAEYEEGWSDERVCELLPPATTTNVANLRVELIGKFRPSSVSTLSAMKYEKMEQDIEKLMAWASRRPREPFQR